MPSDDQVRISITARTEPATEQVGVSAPCWVRYPSTDPTARIVHCGLPWRHDGDHAECDGAPTWPRAALAEAIVRSVAPTRADLERAEQAAYERGVAEGRRQATDGWRRDWGVIMEPDWYSDPDDPASHWPQDCDDEEDARRLIHRGSGRGRTLVSRLVGQWEPAEQAEPDLPSERLSAESVASILAVVDAPYRPGLDVEFVDDEPAARQRLEIMLEDMDVEVVGSASDGLMALTATLFRFEIELFESRSAGWVVRCHPCDITNSGLDEATAQQRATNHVALKHAEQDGDDRV